MFGKVKEFAQTRDHVKTQITFDYMFNCQDVASSKMLYLYSIAAYMGVFLAIGIK